VPEPAGQEAIGGHPQPLLRVRCCRSRHDFCRSGHTEAGSTASLPAALSGARPVEGEPCEVEGRRSLAAVLPGRRTREGKQSLSSRCRDTPRRPSRLPSTSITRPASSSYIAPDHEAVGITDQGGPAPQSRLHLLIDPEIQHGTFPSNGESTDPLAVPDSAESSSRQQHPHASTSTRAIHRARVPPRSDLRVSGRSNACGPTVEPGCGLD
jgi:hypothetical protein